jgi:heptosyltransferase-2
MRSERILVVHVAGIGDAAVASTVAERLRVEHPGAEVTWVCGTAAAPVVKLYEGVDRVVGVDQQRLYRGNPLQRAREIIGLWLRIGRRFDRAVVLHPDPRYRVLVLHLVGVPKVFLSRARHGDMNPIPARFHGDEYARLAGPNAREHVGPIERQFAMADLRQRVPQSKHPRSARPRIVLVPGGARNALREDPLRRWPLESYAALARTLTEDGHEVVVIGARDDAWVSEAFAGIGVTDLVGTLDLVETLGLLRESDLVIAHDTGPMHLTRLVRTPLLALFGPTIPDEMLSMDESVRVIWGGAHLACRPCYDGRNFARCAANLCLSTVEPAQVIETARQMLN